MQKRLDTGTITVPIPTHTSVRRGTLLSIIRQSGLAKVLFETQ
jgi:predicted RNA binding protein YcfA (HicA-like mRNA interferase family)